MGIQQLGAFIRQEREARGITKGGLAAKAKIHRTYLGKIETGERQEPGRDVIRNLAAALGQPEELLTALLYDQPLPRAITPLPLLPLAVPRVAQPNAGERTRHVEEYVYLAPEEARGRSLLAVRIEEASLSPLIDVGDTAILALDEGPQPGDLVVAVLPTPPGGVVVREYVPVNETEIELRGAQVPSVRLPAAAVRVVGVVIEVHKRIRRGAAPVGDTNSLPTSTSHTANEMPTPDSGVEPAAQAQ